MEGTVAQETTSVHDWQRQLIDMLRAGDVLRFGQFTLKSGRPSSYFVNLGLVADGERLGALAGFYARKIVDNLGSASFDVLFGPAYKGIPLVSAISLVLSDRFGVNRPFAFDRKEPKPHAEGGRLVGTPLEAGQRVLMIDDVLTDGATKAQAIDLLRHEAQVEVVGILVCVDRMEPAGPGVTQAQEFSRRTGVPVHALVTRADIETGYGQTLS